MTVYLVTGGAGFIDSNTQLVAPVRACRGAFVGAGATVTQDTPPYALALSRVSQLNKEERVYKPWAKQGELKAKKLREEEN